ncbi:hypothetical protein TpMuguga_04g00583 [Theileria parva strain Muguga]|uniref:uncharacterized protein n=1 Tax=Theileria parva strain Muguga TaxID=333668 RepID=UPI001C61A91E|nr:uncharacterized protein TpMuguga_04g00583 [Theileria parva strain Muguga]EAN31935.2 hypothetical protein TpMuguga_04g00583 [Theileria parva strain Muguga]
MMILRPLLIIFGYRLVSLMPVESVLSCRKGYFDCESNCVVRFKDVSAVLTTMCKIGCSLRNCII